MNDVLIIEKGINDLPESPERWVGEHYGSLKERIDRETLAATGYAPLKHAKFIRVITFKVKLSTHIDAIRRMMEIVHKRFGIACYQAAIYRQDSTARLLCSWWDENTKRGIALSYSDQTKLAVTILRQLHLPRPRSTDGWVRYFLREAYEENPDVFKEALDWVASCSPGSTDFEVIHDALQLALDICKEN
ncbi:MAG: hypothetical protein PUF37_00765 [Prevotellaceae bacterium]|nr:hypothetical protein [Prevotellaceae bacterium]